MEILHFKIEEAVALFTTYDYKRLLEMVNDHFRLNCIRQGIDVETSVPYFNTEKHIGCILYTFTNYNNRAFLPDMDFPFGLNMFTVVFE